MARDGLRIALCLFTFFLPLAQSRAEDRDTVIARKLAVQTALQKGKDLLARNSHEGAVFVLESQIDNIEGNREYLATLRSAYRSYIQDLRLTNREADAQVYERRLRILDPGYALEATRAPVPEIKPPAAPKGKPEPTVRGQMDEQAPALNVPADVLRRKEARGLLTRADTEFDAKHFDAAARLYEQAEQTDGATGADGHERLAYCKLFLVVQQLKQPAGDPPLPDLALEVRRALEIAPKNSGVEEFGRNLLGKIEERRSGKTEDAPAVEVRHYEQPVRGWHVAESTNFRILHNQSRELVESVARVAEKTRADMQRKWFGRTGRDWNPKCDIYLHNTAEDYVRNSPQAPGTGCPGHSTMNSDNGRLLSRRIDLHCDVPHMVLAVLPHETTHCVLAGNFGGKAVPRWADEGMAVLTEPRDRVMRHLNNLPMHRKEGQLFSLKQLIEMDNYPRPELIGAYYAESISLVEFLVDKKGTQVFTQFLIDGLREGYEAALQRNYGIRDYRELEQRWYEFAFNRGGQPALVER